MRKQSEIDTLFAPTSAIGAADSFYLVGVGGAGMSPLAKMLRRRGLHVQGSDSTPSSVIAELIADGIPIRIGHSGDDLRPADALVVSDAIDMDSSPEVARARELGLNIFRRSQLLGWLLKGKKTVAVTGTHGKTTTTGLIGAALRSAGMNPTIVVGATVPEFGGSVVEGVGALAVVEACEAYDSFHDLEPSVIVLTNLELDHVDFHGTFESLFDSVRRFALKLEQVPEGTLVYCEDDDGARAIAGSLPDSIRKLPYGYGQRPPLGLKLAGEHNQLNALGALEACKAVGADYDASIQGLQDFGGAERRLQVLQDGDIAVIDDYAHHPSEVTASIAALRERYPGRRLVIVFQPHLYSRTQGLIPEFARALSAADLVVLTDIYPARELPMAGVSSSRIAELLKTDHRYVPSRLLLPRFVASVAMVGDVVCGMGAGNISEFAPAFIEELARPSSTLVAVLYGGDSAEREVSLHSGIAIEAALRRCGYRTALWDMTRMLHESGSVAQLIGPNRPDLAFLALHGTHAEDGAIQGLLELLHLPYTGSGIQASAIAMDKSLTKSVLRDRGIRVPNGVVVASHDAHVEFEGPWVVKPNAQGSTVGLSFVTERSELKDAIANALRYDKDALVEEWVKGMEVSVPVLGNRALPIVEIVPNSGRYDFAAKYTPGATDEIVPARLDSEQTLRIQELALQAHQAVGCSGATRTDIIVTADGEGVVLEINTLPGMTGTSLLPRSAAHGGMSFDALVDWIARDALVRNGQKV